MTLSISTKFLRRDDEKVFHAGPGLCLSKSPACAKGDDNRKMKEASNMNRRRVRATALAGLLALPLLAWETVGATDPEWNWIAHRSGFPDTANALIWSGSCLVAVGDDGAILTSDDCVHWTVRGSPSSENLLDVAWSGSLFVAVGEEGTILTSPDGVDWELRSSGTSLDIDFVAAGGSSYFVQADSLVGLSGDGITWSLETRSGPEFHDVEWTGSSFVGVDFRSAYHSTDGLNWTAFEITAETNAGFWQIERAGATWFAASAYQVFSSPDAQTWTEEWTFDGNAAADHLGRIAWNGAEIRSFRGAVRTRQASMDWRITTRSPTALFHDLCWANGKYVGIDADHRIVTSPDAMKWQHPVQGASPTNVIRSRSMGGRVIAFGGPEDQGGLYSSADGLNWIYCDPAPFAAFRNGAEVDGRLLAVGDGQVVAESTDGIDWEVIHEGGR